MRSQITLENLKRRVDITRGVRLEANKRLKCKSNFVNSIIFLHTFIIIVITLSIIDKSDSQLNKFVLIYSIGTTIIGLYINSRNYDERALRFEHNYRGLERLSNKISAEANETELKRYIQEYESLIDDKENHESIDYYRFYKSEMNRASSLMELNEPKKYVVVSHYILMFIKSLLLIFYPFFILLFIGLESSEIKMNKIKINVLEIYLGNLAEWLVAIGTLSAVIISLYLARKTTKSSARVFVSKNNVDNSLQSTFIMSVFLNSGQTSIYLKRFYVDRNINSKRERQVCRDLSEHVHPNYSFAQTCLLFELIRDNKVETDEIFYFTFEDIEGKKYVEKVRYESIRS